MKYLRYLSSVLLCFLFLLMAAKSSQAQRVPEYVRLARSNQHNPVSFNRIILPGNADSTTTLATVFHLPYSFLPFKKNNGSSSKGGYHSKVSLNMEVFYSDQSKLRKNKKGDNVSVDGLSSAKRDMWADTAHVSEYSQSQSRGSFIGGFVSTTLEPGIYSYVLKLKQGEQTEARMSKTQSLQLSAYNAMQTGNVILGEKLLNNADKRQLKLSKFGNDVRYASDFYALIYLPNYEQSENYSLKLTSLKIHKKDTTEVGTTYNKELSNDDILNNVVPTLSTNNDDQVLLDLTSSERHLTYALVNIPGSKLANANYRLTVTQKGSNKVAAQDVFQTIWPDIPNSLLSLDVAVDMLSFIASDKTIDKLSNGSKKEREQRFRDYWKKRDPTPETEYNELMVEYYKRIDYAFRNFSSKQILGYKTDQGEIYIKYGAPVNKNRKFPSDGPTIEIWSYPSREIVFKATSGFGDFRLVSNKTK